MTDMNRRTFLGASLAAGLAAAEAAGVRGKDVTPFLLEFFHRETQGASLAAKSPIAICSRARPQLIDFLENLGAQGTGFYETSQNDLRGQGQNPL